MLKRLLVSERAADFASALAARYIRFVYATSDIVREPRDSEAKLFAEHPQILALWHGQFLLLPELKPQRRAEVRAMVSRHGDAALIGAVLERFGIRLIRGAGAGKRRRNRGGATALREALRALAGASHCRPGVHLPSTSPSPASPSSSATRSGCRRLTTPSSWKRGVKPSRRLSPRRPHALMLWLEPEIL